MHDSERGFTLIELISIMVILGILSVIVLPNLSGSSSFKAASFHDQVVAALRYAQKTAVSHRRLVCASLTSTSVTLTIASSNPSSTCSAATLNAPDGNSTFAASTDTTNATFTTTPATPIYFQPSGMISSDGAGLTLSDFNLTVTGMNPIVVKGATGYVN